MTLLSKLGSSKKKVGINVLYIRPGKVGGTQTYADSIIQVLEKKSRRKGEQFQYIIYASKCYADYLRKELKVRNLLIRELPVDGSRAIRILFEFLYLPLLALRDHLTVLHSFGYSSPPLTHCKRVTTIHDLNWLAHPENFNLLEKLSWILSVHISLIFSNHIVTATKFISQQITNYFPGASGKCSWQYYAPSSNKASYRPHFSRKKSELYRILTVSSFAYHKNLDRLVEAFARVKRKYPRASLTVVGLSGKAESLIKDCVVRFRLVNTVKIINNISDRQIQNQYRQANLFVMPSLYEGFGLPVVEAMASGLLVACSNTTSLGEIGKGKAVLFDPTSITSISNALTRAINLKGKKLNELRDKGSSFAKSLTWRKVVDHNEQIYVSLTSS